MRGNRNMGGCPGAGGAGETKSPQERYDLIFLSISTEPQFVRNVIFLTAMNSFLSRRTNTNTRESYLKIFRPF